MFPSPDGEKSVHALRRGLALGTLWTILAALSGVCLTPVWTSVTQFTLIQIKGK